MSGSLIPNAKQQFLDANGNPLAGGKVYFYIPSTTTFKNTYQNAALTILNTNPIILDSAGECIAYGVGSFRQIVTDVNGNLIWDQPTLSLLTNDASNVIYIQGATGSVSRTVQNKLQESISVLDFGADPTGTVDSSLAIQTALNLADTSTGGGVKIYIPRGTYLIGTTLLLPPEINLVGENTGRDGTLSVPFGVVFKAKTGIVDPNGLTPVCIMRDKGISSSPSNPWAYRVQIENIRFEGLSDKSISAYWLGAAADNFKLSRCTFSSLNIGIRIGTDLQGSQIPAYFEHCSFYNTRTWFYLYKCGKSIRINNINGDSAIYVIYADQCGTSLHLGLHQAHIEQLDSSSINGINLESCTGGFYNLSEIDIDTAVPAAWSLVEIFNSTSVYPRIKILGATSNISTYNLLKDNVLSKTYTFGSSPWKEFSYNMQTYVGQGQGSVIDDTNSSSTWTPVISDLSSGGNLATFNLSGARYVYNSGAVTVSFNAAQINTTGMTAGNSLCIQGLPYTSNPSFGVQIGSCSTVNIAGALNACFTSGNSNVIKLYKTGNVPVLVSDVTSSSGQINFTITYIIA
jgi:hypothetical protein